MDNTGEILFKAKLQGRVGIKKNGKKISFQRGRVYVTTSNNYKVWEKYASLCLLQEKARTSTQLPISTPVNLECRFYLPTHQHEADLSNLYQGIEDLLESLGIIENDKLIYSHDGSRKIFGGEMFHVELKVTHHRVE